MGVQNCGTHIFPYNILVISTLGKHFPQTRRSLDRDQAKACLPNKIGSVIEKINILHK